MGFLIAEEHLPPLCHLFQLGKQWKGRKKRSVNRNLVKYDCESYSKKKVDI